MNNKKDNKGEEQDKVDVDISRNQHSETSEVLDNGDVVTTIITTKANTPHIPKQESIKRQTIRDMKDLGVHRPQFNRLVDIYAGLVHQYLNVKADFEFSGYQYDVETASGNMKKSSLVTTMENLRKDILQYSDRLQLNPKSLGVTPTGEEEESPLARLLSGLE